MRLLDFEMIDPSLCPVVRYEEHLLAVQSYQMDRDESTVHGVAHKVEVIEGSRGSLLKLSTDLLATTYDLSKFEVVMLGVPAMPTLDTFQVLVRFKEGDDEEDE